MKKALTLTTLLLALALCLPLALAAGGDAGDPLISLSYLEGVFSQSADAAVDSHLDTADDALGQEVRQRLDAMEAAVQASAGQQVAPTAVEADLKEGDVLVGATGLAVTALAGEVRLSLAAGAVVDVTDGQELADGSLLPTGHRCIVAEAATAYFTVSSPTAVLTYQGSYALSPSAYTTDYFAIARALRDLDLFRGTGTGYGDGFDLHLTPNRGQGLVMFIRILGEEDDALACTYTHPFRDVPAWLDRYVAWAYHRGYSNGVGAGRFGTTKALSAAEYQEFLLRALGYSVAGVQDHTTSLSRALECGAITLGEYEMLTGGDFLRAQVAYLSYYALDMVLSGSQLTLAEQLEAQGVLSSWQLADARSQVTSPRIR